MKSLRTYINEKLVIKQKQKIAPRNRQELNAIVLDHFESHNGDLNDIDVSKLKKEDFYSLFYNLINEIEKNNIKEIDISDWKLKELYRDTESLRGMFEWCDMLESIILPDELETINEYGLYKCTKLNNIIIPKSVTSLGEGAFFGCSGLNSVIIPNLVSSIGDGAFENCIGLTKVTIPDSVTSIDDAAFHNCLNLTITVPNEDIKKLVIDSGFDGKIEIKK